MFITVNDFKVFILDHVAIFLFNNMGCFDTSNWVYLVQQYILPHIARQRENTINLGTVYVRVSTLFSSLFPPLPLHLSSPPDCDPISGLIYHLGQNINNTIISPKLHHCTMIL